MSKPCEWCVSTTETLDSQEYEIEQLKIKNKTMKRECNKRYSEQLQQIRKLQAQVMLQVQSKLFDDE